MDIKALPRRRLALVPTRIQPLSAMSKAIRVPVFVKRDDMTGLVFGGSKVRALEFLLGEAVEKGADQIVTAGSLQSNHCRLTAAAARRLGLGVSLVLGGSRPKRLTGSLLVDAILGSDLRFAETSDREELQKQMDSAVKSLKAVGKHPYEVPPGCATPLGVTGYVVAAEEIIGQIARYKLKVDTIVTATSTGATQAGLLAGFARAGVGLRVLGFCTMYKAAEAKKRIAELANETCKFLEVKKEFAEKDIEVDDTYLGEGYGFRTGKCDQAIAMTACMEGIILDRVHTGKAMAGLIDYARKGKLKGRRILFLHTGGSIELFS